jgi:hypothetical protein
LWHSTRENADDPWGPLVNVQEINSRYNEAFPCLSADGLILYFSDFYDWIAAGDRPGGVGHHDLWMCTRASRNDPWAAPVNMGAPLNSGNAEVSPTISHDGLTFIFASNRSGGGSNYDLWMSTRPAAEGDWAVPVNLGPAVNSSAFDGEVCLSTDGLALFFCSTRPGGMGSYDIWVTTRRSQAAAWSPPVNLGPAIGGDLYGVPIVAIVDFNGDGIVDVKDVVIMTEHWGENYSLCDIGPTSLGDGIVDVQDLVVLTEYIEPIDRSLIAHWSLDETEGDIAQDIAGDNDAFVIGGPLWLPSGGQVDGALQLDGIDDYVSTPFILNPADGAFSVVAWIKGGEPGQVIISQTRGFGGTWLGTNSSEGKLMTGLSDIVYGALESESVVTDGQWHHVGLVYDSSSHRHLYVDGVEVAVDSGKVVGLSSIGGLYIGAAKDLDAGSFFSGLIDDVRIYNRGVTP